MFFDFSGAFLSLLATWYYIQMDKKAWLVTLVATCVNGSLYFQKGLFANVLLEFFYFFNACYGWYYWKKLDDNSDLKSLQYSAVQYLRLLLVILVLFLSLHLFLKTLTASTLPKMDALTTALSFGAQWLMSKRIGFTWVLWFIADALFASMYFMKHMPFHGVQMIFFTGLAVYGYLKWLNQDLAKVPLAD